jgi:hypothetical protein
MPKREADFGFALEPAYARTVPGTRIEHHDRWFRGIEAIVKAGVGNSGNAEQSVIGRLLEPAGIENEFISKSRSGGLPARWCANRSSARCRNVSTKRIERSHRSRW